MAEFMDPDVQDELDAMSGAPTPVFGVNRPLSKYFLFEP